ncbi:hypothetical protein HJG60_010670 [Phyllostomus discolor]|uniref:Uncharacterized protein n=1 Tax=Phyllostomus discolor TaxID=89673 RepID=A0A834ARU3_9CHIR|nr:hypothetical protein HJG60_010670 [Phyllostomus discolor]
MKRRPVYWNIEDQIREVGMCHIIQGVNHLPTCSVPLPYLFFFFHGLTPANQISNTPLPTGFRLGSMGGTRLSKSRLPKMEQWLLLIPPFVRQIFIVHCAPGSVLGNSKYNEKNSLLSQSSVISKNV